MGGRLLEGPTMISRTSDWKDDLARWLKPFLARLGHKARRQMCPLYVSGLIGPGDRKSIQPMAERLALGDYDQLHHFIAAGVWDATPVETELLVQADRLVGGSDAVLVIDDTAIPKKGTHSVGVAPQYALALGKTALANLRLRERAELGRVFDGVIQSLRGDKEGFTYRAIHFDPRPEWVFVLVSSKGIARREVLERAIILTRAAMAQYRKSRCLLVVDRDRESFEVTIGTMNSRPSGDEITAGRKLFGRLKMTTQKYSFVPEAS
jgi:hypothetical protein